MSIRKHEFKKIISSPIFIVLTLIFLVYNTIVIMNKSDMRNNLSVLNEIVDEVGYVINDDMMLELQSYYENQLKDATELLEEKGYSSYDTISEFFENNYIYEGGDSKFNSEEIDFLDKLSIVETYYFLSSELEQKYEAININKMEEEELAISPYNYNTNNIIRENYEKFSIRFKELKSNGEHKNLFFIGIAYRMHSFLFKDIFKTIIYEIMILIVLATSFILNYEFENETASVIYSTKKGRGLIKDKLIVALGSTVLFTTLVIGITLLMYFSVFDYSGLWGTSVNSFFGTEYSLPYMTWWSMSLLKYLLSNIAVVYILEIIFCGLAFVLSMLIKNTYMVFGSYVILVGIGLLLPTLIPAYSNIIIASVYTPFTLVLNPSRWFMFKGGLQADKYYEIIILVIWMIGTLLSGRLCEKKFNRESIK